MLQWKERFGLCFFEPCQIPRTELPQRLPTITGTSCVHVVTVITLSSNALEGLRYAKILQKLGFIRLHCLKVQCRLRDVKPIRSLGTKMAMMDQDMAPCVPLRPKEHCSAVLPALRVFGDRFTGCGTEPP